MRREIYIYNVCVCVYRWKKLLAAIAHKFHQQHSFSLVVLRNITTECQIIFKYVSLFEPDVKSSLQLVKKYLAHAINILMTLNSDEYHSLLLLSKP